MERLHVCINEEKGVSITNDVMIDEFEFWKEMGDPVNSKL